MAKVVVLLEGYVRDGGKTVQGTVTLVQDGGRNIVVDPGMTHGPDDIANALQRQGLRLDDIDTVFLTHHHPDHTRYMGLFQKAKVIDWNSIYDGDSWLDSGDGYKVSPHATLMQTPGHTKEDATLMVTEVTNIAPQSPCTVAICHLWWFEGKDEDRNAQDMPALHASRSKVLALADFIIPGHGGIFSARNN